MTKTNLTIICLTVIPLFAIGVIAVLLWVFKEEVMKLWEKLKEKYGECIGGEKKVSNALDDVEVGSGKGKTDACDYCADTRSQIGELKIVFNDGCDKMIDSTQKTIEDCERAEETVDNLVAMTRIWHENQKNQNNRSN